MILPAGWDILVHTLNIEGTTMNDSKVYLIFGVDTAFTG